MLSVLIPYINEYPQVAFTIASIIEELRDRVDFEIITIDNGSSDKGYKYLQGMATVNPYLKALSYTEKLSHWQSKNFGIENCNGDILWFCDAHCVVGRDSLIGMLKVFPDVEGTLHLPLTYHILERRKLFYSLRADLARAEVHYAFSTLQQSSGILQVLCMSTCGMMIRRELIERIGRWPKELGIYGGGENFLNFTLATLDVPINLYCDGVLHHHGERRGYSWNYRDYLRNRTIAAYIYGGKQFARKFLFTRKDPANSLNELYEDVLLNCAEHRELIKQQQKVTIEEWVMR